MTAASMALQVARSLFVATVLASLLVPQPTDAYFECPVVFWASFDTGASGWSGFVNASGSEFSWRRQSGQTPTSGTGPDNDINFQNSIGHYLYMEEDAGPRGASAIVSTPVITVPSVFQEDCYVTFFYSMQGKDVGQLSIYTVDVGSTVPAPVSWTKTGDQCTSTGWKLAQAKLNYGPGKQFQVYFNATAKENGNFSQGDIGIDSVFIHCCAGCRATNSRSLATFSSGSDGYMNSAADNFDWLRHRGPVPSYPTTQTGPLFDYTTLDPGCPYPVNLGGYYMYIETSSANLHGHQAILWSPPFTAPTTPSTCFVSFWYIMYGATIGSLKVATNLTSQTDARWCRNGQQTSTGIIWARGLFWVQAPGSTFQVSFTGTAGSSSAGDIGLDEIDISCCAESCVHLNRLTFECDNEGLTGRGSNGFTYQTSVTDHTTRINNGARIFANSSQVGTIAKNLTAPNTMGMNCTVSFYFWIDKPSDNAAVANVTTAGMTSGQVVWSLRGATTRAQTWTLQSGSFHLPAPEVSFQVTWQTFFGNRHTWTAIYMDDIDFVCCPEVLMLQSTSSAQTTTPTTTPSIIAPTTTPTTTQTTTPTTPPTITPTTRPTTRPPTTTPTTTPTTIPPTTTPTTIPPTTTPSAATPTTIPPTSIPPATTPTTAPITIPTTIPPNTIPPITKSTTEAITTPPTTTPPTKKTPITPLTAKPTTAPATTKPTSAPTTTKLTRQTATTSTAPTAVTGTSATTISPKTDAATTQNSSHTATLAANPNTASVSTTPKSSAASTSEASQSSNTASTATLRASLATSATMTPTTSAFTSESPTTTGRQGSSTTTNIVPTTQPQASSGRATMTTGSIIAKATTAPGGIVVSSTSVGIVAGAIAGGFVILVLVIFLVVLLLRSRRRVTLPIRSGDEKSMAIVHNPIFGARALRTSPQGQQDDREYSRLQQRCSVQETNDYLRFNHQPATADYENLNMQSSAPPAEQSNIDLTTNTAYGIQRPPLVLPQQVAETSTVGMTTNTAYGVLPSENLPTTEAIYADPTFPEGDQEMHQHEDPDPTGPTEDGPYQEINVSA